MDRKTSILIVDDDVLIAEHLKDILTSYGFERIKMVHNKQDAFKALEAIRPELALLDIRMEGEKDGIEIGKKIKELYKIPFFYITAHSDSKMISQALETNPEGYLTKPFKSADVYTAVRIGWDSYQKKHPKFFTFKDGYTNVRLDINDILYVESENNYITLVTKKKKYVLRHTLEWFLTNNLSSKFIQIHRSYIVNSIHVERVEANQTVVAGTPIPISRQRVEELRKAILGNG